MWLVQFVRAGIIKTVAGVNELYAHDGDNLALKFSDAGTLTHRYLFGDAVDEVLADEDLTAAGGKVFWQMTDHQGSVRRISDGSNGTARTLRYSAFGEMTDVTTLDEQFSYTGREFDEELGPNGLYYYRGRYYDAKTVSAPPGTGFFLG